MFQQHRDISISEKKQYSNVWPCEMIAWITFMLNHLESVTQLTFICIYYHFHPTVVCGPYLCKTTAAIQILFFSKAIISDETLKAEERKKEKAWGGQNSQKSRKTRWSRTNIPSFVNPKVTFELAFEASSFIIKKKYLGWNITRFAYTLRTCTGEPQ